MSELSYWVWLSMKSAVRPETRRALLAHCDGPRMLYFARRDDLRGLGVRLRPSEERALLDKDPEAAERALEICEREGISLITLRDAGYPVRLRRLADAPCVLYVRGRLPRIDDRPAVAVAGTRRASQYGLRTAKRFGADIARSGCILVSGMTAGIDGAAAEGALEAGGVVIGVTGAAIDVPYGGAISARAEASGAVVGEFAPGDRAMQGFRMRNRLTAGLAMASIIVEAPEKSGALLFADETIRQSKELFVVPGNVDAKSAAGSNALLMDGARPASCAWDALADYQTEYPALHRPRDAGSEPVETPPPAQKGIDKENDPSYIDMEMLRRGLNEPELLIVAELTRGELTLDDLLERTGLSSPECMSELTMLQIMGIVRQAPGKRYALGIAPVS